MRTTYRYTVIDGQGNIVLNDVRSTDIISHFKLSRNTKIKSYAVDGMLIKHEYNVVISGADEKDRGLSERLMQCWKFTAQMLAEWDCMNRRYGRRFRT